MKITRRNAIGIIATTAAFEPQAAAQTTATDLLWLESPPPLDTGVSWGVPWPRGAVRKEQTFALAGLPLQTWPLAYWPDGSVKFSGFATVAGPSANNLRLAPGTPPAANLKVTTTAKAVDIEPGKLPCR